MSDAVHLRREGALIHLTLNRPDKANALRAEDRAALRDACAEIADDPEARAVILTGTGEKVFCAGIHLPEIEAAAADPADYARFNADLTETFGAVAALPQYVIARLNGTAAGAGLALAMACDVRLASDRAGFFYPVVKRGVVPPAADVRRLTALIGPARAKTMLISGLRIDVATAESWGLIEASAPMADLDALAQTYLEGVLEAPPPQIQALKALVHGADDDALTPAYEALFGG